MCQPFFFDNLFFYMHFLFKFVYQNQPPKLHETFLRTYTPC